MKISIVIPIYNVSQYIADCLNSVFAQTYAGAMECLLVDDCGTDDSMRIVDELLANYHGPISFRILHHEHNRGLSAARNTGMEAATGDYVYFLDSDDYVPADCIEQLVRPLRQGSVIDVVVGDYQQVGDEQPIKRALSERTIVQPFVLHAYNQWQWYTMAWNKLSRLDYIRSEQLLFKEGMIHEDELWTFQVACTARAVYVTTAVTYVYRLRGNSIVTGTSLQKKMSALTTVLQEMWAFATHRGVVHDTDVYEKFQSMCINNLKLLRGDREQFAQQYRRQRQIVRYGWSDVFRMKGFTIYRLLRDIHCLMPISMADRWLYFVLTNCK